MDYTQGNVRKIVIFEELKLKYDYNILTKLNRCLEGNLLFQWTVKIFLWVSRTCSSYLDEFPNRVLCVSEKLDSCETSIKIYRRKAWGGVFYPPSRQVNSEKVPSMSLLRVFAFYFSGLSEKILLKSEIGEVHGRFEGRKQVRGVKISVRGETLLQCAKKIEFQMQVTRCCAAKFFSIDRLHIRNCTSQEDNDWKREAKRLKYLKRKGQ